MLTLSISYLCQTAPIQAILPFSAAHDSSKAKACVAGRRLEALAWGASAASTGACGSARGWRVVAQMCEAAPAPTRWFHGRCSLVASISPSSAPFLGSSICSLLPPLSLPTPFVLPLQTMAPDPPLAVARQRCLGAAPLLGCSRSLARTHCLSSARALSLDCRMILRKIRVFFARKPLLTRSKPFMRPIRRTRAVRDVATLSGFGIGQELYCKDDLAVLLLFRKNYPLLLRPAEHGDHATGGRADGTQRGVGNGFRNSGLALKRNYRPSL